MRHASTRRVATVLVPGLVIASLVAVPAGEPRPGKSLPRFVPHRVGTARYEPCGVGDFNNDGKLDIVSGPILYLAPDWKAVKIRSVDGSVDDKGDGYYHDFMNAPLDVDGDGLLDVVSCDWFCMCIEWHRNNGGAAGEWEKRLVEKSGNHECGDLVDIDGDGKALEILVHVQPTIWWEVGKLPDGTRGLVKHVICQKPSEFGAGVGDVNGDGRPDVLRPTAWYEAPADPRSTPWKEHPLAVGHVEEGKSDHTAQILVLDVNADGRNDIVASSAHQWGIFWYEQLPGEGSPKWKQHVIDKSWTQAHALTLADLDRDGDLDLVTGKRFRAHNGGDPGESDPLIVCWYELDPGPTPKWTRHDISSGEMIGAALSIPVLDFDGDGDLDIVVSGKWGGPVWFENTSGGDSAGWIDLMPPADLKGWSRVPVPPGAPLGKQQWRVEEGGKLLVCDGDGGHDMLLCDREFGDAVFHAEFRYTKVEGKSGYNSGVYVRNNKDGSLWHQAQIGDASGGYLFGETPGADGKKKFFTTVGDVKDGRVKPAGEWNTLEIEARGKVLTLRVNDAVTCEVKDCGNPKGLVGVEGEGYRIEFRNLKVKELKGLSR